MAAAKSNKKIKVPVGELQVGMYIILDSWLGHPFLKSRFRIESKSQIKQMADYGFKEITVDPSRSTAIVPARPDDPPGRMEVPGQWRPEDLVPPEFRSILKDRNMEPAKKAEAVKQYSLCMMKKLIESPSSENIGETKSAVYDIVDMVLDEQETANQLINITAHDAYTYTHSVNVGMIAIMIAKSMFRPDGHNFKEIGAGFFLHDLGKVRIDSGIINKPGKLTPQEFEQIKMHPVFGYQVLQHTVQLSKECGQIVLQHHERVDGRGYPQGLAREEIHIYARICTVADVYDALTSERSYKKSLKPFDALVLMRDEMPGQMQKDIFEHLVYILHGTLKNNR